MQQDNLEKMKVLIWSATLGIKCNCSLLMSQRITQMTESKINTNESAKQVSNKQILIKQRKYGSKEGT